MTETPPDEDDSLLSFRYDDNNPSGTSQSNNPPEGGGGRVNQGSPNEGVQSSGQAMARSATATGDISRRNTPGSVHGSQPQTPRLSAHQMPQQVVQQQQLHPQEQQHQERQHPQIRQLPQQIQQQRLLHQQSHQLPPTPPQLQPVRALQQPNLYNRQSPPQQPEEQSSSYGYPSYSVPLSPPEQQRHFQQSHQSTHYGRQFQSHTLLAPSPQPQSRLSSTYDNSVLHYQQPQSQLQQPQTHFPLPSPPVSTGRSSQTIFPSGIQPGISSSSMNPGLLSGLPTNLASNVPSGLPNPGGPFSYTPTYASTTQVRSDSRISSVAGPSRRRRTSSKRSLEEDILESAAPTNININIPTDMGFGGPSRLSGGPSGSRTRSFRQIGLLRPVESPEDNEFASAFGVPPLGSGGTFTLPLNVPEPPLSSAVPSNSNALQPDQRPRPKKKSKYTAEQDNLILEMKRAGKSWSEIAEAAQCTDHLAARNRYQVLIGQQGGGAVVWDAGDITSMKNILEEGEKVKWEHVASELTRMRSKSITADQCRAKIKQIFDHSPDFFGIVIDQNMMSFAPVGGTLPGLPFPPVPFHQQQLQPSQSQQMAPPPLNYGMSGQQQQPLHQHQPLAPSVPPSQHSPYQSQQNMEQGQPDLMGLSQDSNRYSGGGYGPTNPQDASSHEQSELYPPPPHGGYGGQSDYIPPRR